MPICTSMVSARHELVGGSCSSSGSRGGAKMIRGQAEKLGVAHPGEGSKETLLCDFSGLKGSLSEGWGQTL